MIRKYVILGTIFMILVTAFSNVSVLVQGEGESASGNQSEIDVETKMNDSKVPVNINDVIKSLNFSCDIDLNCFDKKNKVELVILANNTSTVKGMFGQYHTNGLLMIPYINSSFDKFPGFMDRGGNIRIGDLYGIRSSHTLAIEQFFGEKNYSLPQDFYLFWRK